MGVKRRNRYTEAFRVETVRRIVEEGIPVPDLAKSLGIDSTVLYRWVRKAAAKKAKPGTSAADDGHETVAEELKRLRREVAELRTEKEILKKAAAFFAKESENK